MITELPRSNNDQPEPPKQILPAPDAPGKACHESPKQVPVLIPTPSRGVHIPGQMEFQIILVNASCPCLGSNCLAWHPTALNCKKLMTAREWEIQSI